jgi:hypothetical protein
MITDDDELKATLERIRHLQDQVAYLRRVETNPANYHLFQATPHPLHPRSHRGSAYLSVPGSCMRSGAVA